MALDLDAVAALNRDPVFAALLVFGTIAFAISGAVAAMRVGMDLVGVLSLAVLTAVGGGSLRDVVLGNLPMWWVTQWWAVLAAVLVAVVLVPWRGRFRADHAPDSWRVVIVADALGLAAFSVVGAAATLALGFAPWLAVAMGVLTAVGGGVLRDVLANTPPLVFTGQVYATAAVAGAALFVLLLEFSVPLRVSYLLPTLAVVAIRVLAIRRRWEFPALQIDSR